MSLSDTQRAVVERTAEFIRQSHSGEGSGHDWFHIERVWRMAVRLLETEPAERFVTELAALLHDVADWKFHAGDETAGPRAADEWLIGQGVEEETRTAVCEIVRDLSFKGAGVPTPMRTLAGQIVQDADRLDAIGAIGVARAFAYGGSRGRPMYDPQIPPTLHASFAEYKRNAGPTVNHFYEKLLLLQERMNTAAARAIAAERTQFMEQFLRQFFREWSGEDA